MDAKQLLKQIDDLVNGTPLVITRSPDGGLSFGRMTDLARSCGLEQVSGCDHETLQACLRDGDFTDSRFYCGNESPVLTEDQLHEA